MTSSGVPLFPARFPVGIALGSNMGDREAMLNHAVAFLSALSFNGLLRQSRRYETEPVNCPPGGGPYLNAVVEIVLNPGEISPRQLLEKLKRFEREQGRAVVYERNAPRPLDLDILYYGNQTIQEPGLTIPHPRAAGRAFVLEPLADIRPELILPGQTSTVRELWGNLQKNPPPQNLPDVIG